MTKASDWAQKKLRELLSKKGSPVSGTVQNAIKTEEKIRDTFWKEYGSK